MLVQLAGPGGRILSRWFAVKYLWIAIICLLLARLSVRDAAKACLLRPLDPNGQYGVPF